MATCFGFAEDITVKDSLKDENSLLGFDLIMAVGLGSTTYYATLDQYMKPGPVMSLSVELPLIQSNNFSFELFAHTWYAKFKNSDDNI